jgi:hypothetical protein
MMALFYSPTISKTALKALALGIAAEVADRVEFAEESGGEEPRELGVPLLPDADEIEVTEAEIRMAAAATDTEVGFDAVDAADGNGVIVTLARPAHLRKVEIAYTAPAAPPAPLALRTVIRGATRQGSGYSFTPPLFAHPAFPKPGPMYGDVLAGLKVTSVAGGRRLLEVDGVPGTSWLIQIASASSPTDLLPLPVKPTVHRVVIRAAPSNLRIIMKTEEGDVPLWANPGLLLPEAGQQEINFRALAQRQLGALLKKTSAAPGHLTLPVSLRFASDSAGAIAVNATTLTARYKVLPLGPEPRTLPIGGDWTPLNLRAPAGAAPEASALDVTVKLAGRELNAGSAVPPVGAPSSGLRVDVDVMAAAAIGFQPLPGRPPGSVLPLASVRLFLAAREAAEAVLEIRNDSSGVPGELVARPLPVSLEKDVSGWVEFLLPSALPASAGQAPLWIALRANRGELLWFATGEAAGVGPLAERVSIDRGRTWAEPERPLTAAGVLLVQLYHALEDPLPRPTIQLLRGATVLAADLFASAARKGPREFAVAGTALPPAVLTLLGARPGSGKVETELRLYSPSVGEVTVENASLFYEPFGAAASILGAA